MSNYDLETIRHSAAHLMAAAVQQLFPEAKFDIGPATADGFYYDFDMEHRLVPEDLKKIDKKMIEIDKKKLIMPPKPIKEVGSYEVGVKLPYGLTATIKVEVKTRA